MSNDTKLDWNERLPIIAEEARKLEAIRYENIEIIRESEEIRVEDQPSVYFYSVFTLINTDTRTFNDWVFTHEVTIEMLCDRLNAPEEEKHHIDFGMNRKYFPSLEAANDFITSRRESNK